TRLHLPDRCRHTSAVGLDLEQCRAQIQAQRGIDQLQKISGWFTARHLHKPSHRGARVHHVIVLIDEYARGCELLHHFLVQLPRRGKVLAPVVRGCREIRPPLSHHEVRRQLHRTKDCPTAVEAPSLVDRKKQGGDAVGRFRTSQEQKSIRPQREMKNLQNLFLHLVVQVNQ